MSERKGPIDAQTFVASLARRGNTEVPPHRKKSSDIAAHDRYVRGIHTSFDQFMKAIDRHMRMKKIASADLVDDSLFEELDTQFKTDESKNGLSMLELYLTPERISELPNPVTKKNAETLYLPLLKMYLERTSPPENRKT